MNKNLIRHQTLKILAELSYKEVLSTNEDKLTSDERSLKLEMPTCDLWQKIGVSETEFRKANVYLTTRKEFEYVDRNKVEKACIQPEGIDAYEDNKYLKLRNAERHETIYSFTKWAVPIAALVVSAAAIYFTINQRKPPQQINIWLQLKDTAIQQTAVHDTATIVY